MARCAVLVSGSRVADRVNFDCHHVGKLHRWMMNDAEDHRVFPPPVSPLAAPLHPSSPRSLRCFGFVSSVSFDIMLFDFRPANERFRGMVSTVELLV